MLIIRMKWSEVKSLSRVRLFATLWTVAYQAPLSVGFSRQEHWSGLLFLSPGDLPNPGIEPGSPAFQADALPSEPPGKLYVKYMKCSVTAGFCFGFGQMYYYYHQHVFFLNQVLVVCFVNSLFVNWVNLWPHNWSSTFSLWKTFWRMPQILNIFHYFIYIYIFFFSYWAFFLLSKSGVFNCAVNKEIWWLVLITWLVLFLMAQSCLPTQYFYKKIC